MTEASRSGVEPPHPALQAILLCDSAIREAVTNKVTLVGIYDRFHVKSFPFTWNRPSSVYARITDAAGSYTFRLELVRLDDEQAVGRQEVQGELEDRLGAHEVIFGIQRMSFERAGRYELRLFCNGRHLGSVSV